VLASQVFGAAGYTPVAGDYDGDGRADLTVYQESTGTWYVLSSSGGQLAVMPFGAPDIPIQ
jgi:hypothetical protein